MLVFYYNTVRFFEMCIEIMHGKCAWQQGMAWQGTLYSRSLSGQTKMGFNSNISTVLCWLAI